ncbi:MULTISPECIES: GNAT family N-acetyltransferase [Streptomyces]|uniref:GNAT superfamily N-acetyltransferase n=1 Tax=Streptomyces clavifer TaxID=68188 RepID=A0ABS4VA01_9ACTN|nr:MULTISPECIES: GNAT family N-acetyltransferase [Streptomyces]MBP2360748.1 GNAT superfamily N-acetyltransferase [Streptomyces clavifer]MDX2746076.1 GNAT family N-acetyltransferase [Streptomyces sp. NRRL_B-2557]GHB11848.1 N-acetyltransferase [Streptomyces clavifer]
MALTFEVDPAFDRALRDGITALWVDVTNAGGAVGFVAPVTAGDVRPELVKHLSAMVDGRTRLVVGRDEHGTVAATAFLTHNAHRLMRHWIGLYTVMVHPRHQGKGYGRELMGAAADAARAIDGIDAVRLTCRGGTGADRFYASCGYKEVGRIPNAIRVAEDDYRDDIIMLLPLFRQDLPESDTTPRGNPAI